MEIAEGTLLKIEHTRKGTIRARATKDFDTDDIGLIYWPLAAAEDIRGTSKEVGWPMGAPMPCRSSFVTSFEVMEE